MEFYCENCEKTLKLKSKNNHLKSLTPNQYMKCFHKKRNINNTNFFDKDTKFNDYITHHNRKIELFLINCEN